MTEIAMTKSAFLAVLPLMFSASFALADASEEGAERLRQVFQTYLGSTEGVVTVALDGDGYAVTLDAAPLAGLAADAGGKFSLTPLVLSVTDLGNGTWNVVQDQSISLAYTIPDAADVRQDIGAMRYEGVFDEALMTFSSARGEMSDIKITETVTDPVTGPMVVEASVASGRFELTGVAGAAGGVDSTYTTALSGLSESFTTPASDGMPSMPVTLTVEALTQNGKVEGLRPDPIFKLLAWSVSNPTVLAAKANRGQLKPILLEGFPIFAMVAGDMTASTILASTPMGEVGIAEASVTVGVTGAVPDGRLREAITLTGLTLPAGTVPDWALPILPQQVKFDFEIGNFDAAAGFTALLDLLDLPEGAEPDQAMNDRIAAAFLPENSIAIRLNPGHVSGDGVALTFEGDLAVMLDMPIPTGKGVVTLTGIEKLQAAMAAAPQDMQMQAMMFVGMAQGLAKPGADGALVWEIDATTPGSVAINGVPMGAGE
jgi:hypothetical protein